ncbi:MAG: hypothetical protein KDB24_17845, partial [Microthrixaceae bacterium]|nr:hypothetical protein [Microthrixaceae bacterium]
MRPPVTESRPAGGPSLPATVGLVLASGVAAALVASFGTMGLYGALAVVGVGVLAVLLRDQLAPVFADARDRARSLAADPRVPAIDHPRLWAWTVVLTASFLAFAAVTAGTKVAIAAAGLPVAAAGAWLAWPLIRELTLRPPEGLVPRPAGPTGSAVAEPEAGRRAFPPVGVTRAELPGATIAGAAIVVLSAGGIGFFAAGLGFKGLLVAIGATLAGAAYLLVRHRTTFGMFATTV